MNTIRLSDSLGPYLAQCFIWPAMGETVCKDYQQWTRFVATSEERIDLSHEDVVYLFTSAAY